MAERLDFEAGRTLCPPSLEAFRFALNDTQGLVAVKLPDPIIKEDIKENPISYFALAPENTDYNVHQIDSLLLRLLDNYRNHLERYQLGPLRFQVDNCVADWPKPIEAARLSFSEHIGRVIIDRRIVLDNGLTPRRSESRTDISSLYHELIADIFPDKIAAMASKEHQRKANFLSPYAVAKLRRSTKKETMLGALIKLSFS